MISDDNASAILRHTTHSQPPQHPPPASAQGLPYCSTAQTLNHPLPQRTTLNYHKMKINYIILLIILLLRLNAFIINCAVNFMLTGSFKTVESLISKD